MNDDPSEVDVLYGKVSIFITYLYSHKFWNVYLYCLKVESKTMQRIADEITNYFIDAGLIQRQYDHVKMHVTLINTLFRKPDEATEAKGNLPRARKTFDARSILKKYATFEFGRQTVTEIHLSQRFSTASNKFFEATGILKVA